MTIIVRLGCNMKREKEKKTNCALIWLTTERTCDMTDSIFDNRIHDLHVVRIIRKRKCIIWVWLHECDVNERAKKKKKWRRTHQLLLQRLLPKKNKMKSQLRKYGSIISYEIHDLLSLLAFSSNRKNWLGGSKII